jgi:LDH2 family malate/lactate/ureidoglycolate dehydrogenase
MDTPRFPHRALVEFASALLTEAGLEPAKSESVARILVEADLLGHDTHGLAQCADYLDELRSGAMAGTGGVKVIADFPAASVWDGRRLPGPWLVERAIEAATAKAASCGTGTITIRHSHHIACLAAFLEAPARAGKVVLIACSDPSTATVAPFGGVTPVMTPNPLAVGYPTEGDPAMIDISTSITTNALVGRAKRAGGVLPGRWLIGSDGRASDDPAVLETPPPGALLPVGGLDHGHKGFGLGLAVEALTQGLAGFGRAETPREWGAAVFVQVLDPALFAGTADFNRETGWLADACRAARPADPERPVRLPGEAGLRRKAERLRSGVPIRAETWAALSDCAERAGVAQPTPLSPSGGTAPATRT